MSTLKRPIKFCTLLKLFTIAASASSVMACRLELNGVTQLARGNPRIKNEVPKDTQSFGPVALAIISPNNGDDLTTDSESIELSGICSPNVVTVSVAGQPSSSIRNNCSVSGTWSASVDLGWSSSKFLVTGSSDSGLLVTDTITLTRTIIIGQSDYAATKTPFNFGSSASNAGMRIWTDGVKMAVTDPVRHRVLLFNSMPTQQSSAPDLILGQKNAVTAVGGCTQDGLNGPRDVHFDGQRLWVADTGNHRVLSWEGWPSANGQAASLVLGQANFTLCSANRASTTASNSLSTPVSIWSDGTLLAVSDSSNNRVLIWNTAITLDGQAANVALGQTSFTTSAAGGYTASSLGAPQCAGSDGVRFFVCDGNRGRFLIWNSIPNTMNATANVVLGSSSFTTIGSQIAGQRMRTPVDFAVRNERLFVVDAGENVVLVFDGLSTLANGTIATMALGQKSFAGLGSANCGLAMASAQCLRFPSGIAVNDDSIHIADHGNGRIMSWNAATLETGTSASKILGASSFAFGAESLPDRLPLSDPKSVAVAGSKMAIVDNGNRRVLIYNSIPASPNETPAVILGQTNGTAAILVNTPTQSNFQNPYGVATDGTRLFVSDPGFHRILVWNSWPINNNQPADFVLGQIDFVSGGSAIEQGRLSAPYGLSVSNNTLAVADYNNHRVLLWNVTALSNGANASVVVGQSLFTANSSGTTAATLKNPKDVLLSATSLVVSDSGNNRVLVWSSIPSADGTSANRVLGQVDFTTGSANRGLSVPSAATLSNPTGLVRQDHRLYVSDTTNNRILVWNNFDTVVNGQTADFYLGQYTSSSSSPVMMTTPLGLASSGSDLIAVMSGGGGAFYRWSTAPTTHFESPGLVFRGGAIWNHSAGFDGSSLGFWITPHIANDKLFVVDRVNNRILAYNSVPTRNNPHPDYVLGQPDFYSTAANTGGLGPLTLNNPGQIFYAREKFIVPDIYNNRVLIWNGVPISATDPPDIVLGQPNFYTNVKNIGPPLRSLQVPAAATVVGNQLYISDWSNNRILVWNDLDNLTSFQPADKVIGQDSEFGTLPNKGLAAPTQNSLSGPTTCSDGVRLVVPDQGNRRVLLWDDLSNLLPFSTNAKTVLGQPDFFTSSLTAQTPTAANFRAVSCTFSKAGKLVIGDLDNARILIWNDPSALTNGQGADAVWGQPDFFTSGFSGTYSARHLDVRTVYSSTAAGFENILFLGSQPGYLPNGLTTGRLLMIPMP